jgi:riboflavin kinase/FMN adenylyltransferase
MHAAAQPKPPRAAASAVFAPGNHDGVHLGHQALVRTARAYAQSHGLRAVALTFDPHPLALLAKDRAPMPLTTLERRRELLLHAGADDVIVQPFTHEFASLSPERFLHALMAQGACALVVGPDFHFAQNRAGDVALLERFGAEHDLRAIVEPPLCVLGERVSSSAVRSTVAAGDVTHATTLLGHVFDITGEVVTGQQRGRLLGFPTANLRSDPVLHPADGVYAVVARVVGGSDGDAGVLLRGVANLGTRPTLEAGRALEVHLFDFAGDLYGARLRVGFVGRIRAERKFPDLGALTAQIALDCQAARATLDAADEGTWAWI